MHVFKALTAAPSVSQTPNTARWYKHILSYNAEHSSLPGTSTAGEVFVGAAGAVPAKAAAADDDDEVDLFGSDEEEEDEETKKKKEEVLAQYHAKKAAKPKTVAKVSCIILSNTGFD